MNAVNEQEPVRRAMAPRDSFGGRPAGRQSPAIAAGRAQPVPSACWSSGQAWCRSRCQYGQLCVPGP